VTTLVIRLTRSAIGEKWAARRTLAALGLRRVGQVVVRQESPALRGMVKRVAHLVVVEEKNAAA
jgi:large subunit ribosomal protein L30